MVNTFTTVLYAFLVGAAAFLGASLVIFSKKLDEKKIIYMISFSAGVLLSLALIDIIPEASALSPDYYLYGSLGAFLLLYFLEQKIIMHSCSEDGCDHHHFERGKGLMGLWGIFLHSVIDGAIVGVGFEVSPAIGIATALAVLIHKIPDGISVSSIMLHSGFSKKEVIRGALYIALATPIGTLLAIYILSGVTSNVLGIALGVSAGTFLYISASDLIPETHKKFNSLNGYFVALGALIIVLLKVLL